MPAPGGSCSPASYIWVTSASRESALSRASPTVWRVTDTCTRTPSSDASAQHITVMNTADFQVSVAVQAGQRQPGRTRYPGKVHGASAVGAADGLAVGGFFFRGGLSGTGRRVVLAGGVGALLAAHDLVAGGEHRVLVVVPGPGGAVLIARHAGRHRPQDHVAAREVHADDLVDGGHDADEAAVGGRHVAAHRELLVRHPDAQDQLVLAVPRQVPVVGPEHRAAGRLLLAGAQLTDRFVVQAVAAAVGVGVRLHLGLDHGDRVQLAHVAAGHLDPGHLLGVGPAVVVGGRRGGRQIGPQMDGADGRRRRARALEVARPAAAGQHQGTRCGQQGCHECDAAVAGQGAPVVR